MSNRFKYYEFTVTADMVYAAHNAELFTSLRLGRYFCVTWGDYACVMNTSAGEFTYGFGDDGVQAPYYLSTATELVQLTALLKRMYVLAYGGDDGFVMHESTGQQLYDRDEYELTRVIRQLLGYRIGGGKHIHHFRDDIRQRIDVLASNHTQQLGQLPLSDNQIERKGMRISAAKFNKVLNAAERLADNIKFAIAHDDWSEVAEEIRIYERRCASIYFRLNNEALERFNELKGDEGYLSRLDCGHVDDRDNMRDDVGRRGHDEVCCVCFNDDYVYVEDEDAYWHSDEAYYHDSDGNYYSYEQSDDEDEDEDDDDDEDGDGLMGYSVNVLHHTQPDSGIRSSHFGEFLMGVELEMCSGDSSVREAAEDVREELGYDYCITKSDGSLPHDGFEVVTAPRGLAEHIKRFKDWDINASYRAWNTNRCGLHVHIDSRAFNATALGKFIQFINANDNADFIRKVAGRHPLRDEQARSYCASESQNILVNTNKALKHKDPSRYRMVNTAGLDRSEMRRLGMDTGNCTGGKFNTVELRIFRASLKKERLLSQIEFTHAAVMFCRTASMRDLTGEAFKTWLSKHTSTYPSLAKWYEVAPKKKAAPNAQPTQSADETVSA